MVKLKANVELISFPSLEQAVLLQLLEWERFRIVKTVTTKKLRERSYEKMVTKKIVTQKKQLRKNSCKKIVTKKIVTRKNSYEKKQLRKNSYDKNSYEKKVTIKIVTKKAVTKKSCELQNWFDISIKRRHVHMQKAKFLKARHF